jgi:hypothetical protein
MSFQPLDGPSLQEQQNVTDSTVFRVKVDTTEFKDRDVVTIIPIDGKIWVFFGDGITIPNAATVKAKGFPQAKGSLRTYEASGTQEIYIVADTGTVDVRYAERG